MSRIGVYERRMSRMGLGHQVYGVGAYGVMAGLLASVQVQWHKTKVKNGYRGRRQNLCHSKVK